MKSLDCIVIGHNDVDFSTFARSQEAFKERSAAHSEIVTNSILDGSDRRTYMELLNRVLEEVSGRPWSLNAFELPSLATAYLVSYLRRAGFRAEALNSFASSKEQLVELLDAGAKTVAVTTTYYVDNQPISEIVKFVRERSPKTKIIVGGPRVLSIANGSGSIVQDLQLRLIGADVYVRSSQGEATLAQVVGALSESPSADLTKIDNLILPDPNSRGCTHTAVKVEDNDLDKNAVDWSSFDARSFTPTTYMRTARSCPFTCAFCNYPSMAGSHTLASVETVEREMRYLADRGLQYLIIIDDTFNVPLPRFKELCRMMIRNNFPFEWVSFFRCSNADDEAFDLMRESGCLGVYLGIESADQDVLEKMNKFAKVPRYEEGIRKLHERGILTLVSLILGFPGETAASVDNTISFVNAAAPTFYNVQIYYHDALAPVELLRDQFGIRGSGYSWSHATMNWQEAVERKERMIQNITSSILLPLYGFSIWTIPYLLQHGMSIEQIQQFGRFANDLSHAEMKGTPKDLRAAISEFCRRGYFDEMKPGEHSHARP